MSLVSENSRLSKRREALASSRGAIGTTTRRVLLIACVSVVIAALSAIAMTPRSFTLISPFPLLVAATWLILAGGNTMNPDLSRVASALIIPLLFLLWGFPLFRGEAVIPSRSRWAAVILVVLSCAYLGWSAQYGVEFQGSVHTFGVIGVNLLIGAALVALYVFNRRHATFAKNLLFHAVLFCWLGTYAFPFLGEGP